MNQVEMRDMVLVHAIQWNTLLGHNSLCRSYPDQLERTELSDRNSQVPVDISAETMEWG